MHKEWIELHDYPEFHTLVEFLRSEVDRIGERSDEDRAIIDDYFGRAVQLELDFFNNSYEQPLEV